MEDTQSTRAEITPTDIKDREVLTAEEAGVYAHHHPRTLKRLAKDGKLRARRKNPDNPNSPWLFTKKWLDEYLESGATGGEK